MKKKLTNREKEFCSCFAASGNLSLSARRAGFAPDGEQLAEKLLCKKEITDEITRLASARRKALANMAASGYYRLAFGSIADAVSLLFTDSPSKEELDKMDLFSVSEIKRPKDGSMEIKFFDRLKALEHLESETEEETTARDFFDAIGKSADSCGDTVEN